MNDKELIQEFITTIRNNDFTEIIVKEIYWPNPHTPESKLTIAKTLMGNLTKAEIDEEIVKIINNKKYFGQCKMCDERNPNGWMHDDKICQSCSEEHLGVTY